MIDQTIAFNPLVVFAIGFSWTFTGYWIGYWRGARATKATSDKFWAMQQKIKAINAAEKWAKASKAAYKGHETRRRMEEIAGVIVNSTECDH